MTDREWRQSKWPRAERDECASRLRRWRDEIGGFVAWFPEDMREVDVGAAQARLRRLKAGLREEAKRVRTLADRGQLSEILEALYLPALEDAAVDLTVRVNSRPTDEWLNELDSARERFEYYMPRSEGS